MPDKMVTDGFRRILTSMVGSRAHGTDTATSDVDMRYVMLVPTSEIVKMGYTPKFARERDPTKDENFWELQRFLELCTKGNNSTLEVLLAPVEESTPEGDELRAMFPKFLKRKSIYWAHFNFAVSNRKTMDSPTSG